MFTEPDEPASNGLGRSAWRQALIEELRSMWTETAELIEVLSMAPVSDANSGPGLGLQRSLRDAEEQLGRLTYVADRLCETVPKKRSEANAALFWKREALRAEIPPGLVRDSRLLRFVQDQTRHRSLKWLEMASLARKSGLPEIADVLSNAAYDRQQAGDSFDERAERA
jgi:hypothetical protein